MKQFSATIIKHVMNMVETFESFTLGLTWEKLGFSKDLVAIKPFGVDLFLSGLGETHLPEKIARQLKLLEQAKQRRELSQNIGRIFEQVSDLSIDMSEAVDKGEINSEDLVRVYQNLADFIEADENNARIILYLPFQLLPKTNREKQLLKNAAASQAKFAEICRDAWIRLLFESEPRANFMDGDVLEDGLGEPERGRKAGHLTADLLERGIIQVVDIINLLDISTEEELLKSLTEGVIVARDRNLIDKEVWEKIITLSKEKPAISIVLKSAFNPTNETQTSTAEDEVENKEQWLDTIANQLKSALDTVVIPSPSEESRRFGGPPRRCLKSNL